MNPFQKSFQQIQQETKHATALLIRDSDLTKYMALKEDLTEKIEYDQFIPMYDSEKIKIWIHPVTAKDICRSGAFNTLSGEKSSTWAFGCLALLLIPTSIGFLFYKWWIGIILAFVSYSVFSGNSLSACQFTLKNMANSPDLFDYLKKIKKVAIFKVD